MYYAFNKLYVLSGLVVALSAVAQGSAPRAGSSPERLDTYTSNATLIVPGASVLTTKYIAEPLATTISIPDLEITHSYTSLTPITSVHDPTPTSIALTTTPTHPCLMAISTIAIAQLTNITTKLTTEQISVAIVTPMIPVFNPDPSMNDRTAVNGLAPTVRITEPPSPISASSTRYSLSVSSTALVAGDDHPEGSEQQNSDAGGSIPVALVILLVLVFLRFFPRCYMYLKRRWERRGPERTFSMFARGWDEEDWAIWRQFYGLAEPSTAELGLAGLVDDSASWVGPEVWAPEYVKMMGLQPAAIRNTRMSTRSTVRWSDLSMAMTVECPSSKDGETGCLPPVDFVAYKLSRPERAYTI
ncbi:hypothetical protein PIIN_03685 [Serendipita indica DSM 11827]|uniref:Uncharacterized protein n=1 Tax=Serendipita indica (strain DSM 11827) TaxID=1109443 RepID=G4TEJ5_SERID|nr:hypothetical protein PIIN_03685 [Serendipita indica DSM 11827]